MSERYPNLDAAMKAGKVDGSGLPDPSKRTVRPMPDDRPESPTRERCARDSDWCDGVICREWGKDFCPNADPLPAPSPYEEAVAALEKLESALRFAQREPRYVPDLWRGVYRRLAEAKAALSAARPSSDPLDDATAELLAAYDQSGLTAISWFAPYVEALRAARPSSPTPSEYQPPNVYKPTATTKEGR